MRKGDFPSGRFISNAQFSEYICFCRARVLCFSRLWMLNLHYQKNIPPMKIFSTECGDLQTKLKKLNNENNTLKTDLLRLAEECQNIEMENSSIKVDLKELYGEELTSILENDQVEDGHSGVLNPERLDSGEGENKIRDCSGGSNSVSDGYQCCGLRLEHVNGNRTEC
ncbi:hypothetical protein IFM89_028092 [Coptis chinensis]|uniref:Uncharacterized protein n=1 Tax=Coptis chinensis TaxID=261450 RepID=A0A835M0Z1_9MAGN|nr:hypothetical protein IFM89_028092 [Coptis chinensis]